MVHHLSQLHGDIPSIIDHLYHKSNRIVLVYFKFFSETSSKYLQPICLKAMEELLHLVNILRFGDHFQMVIGAGILIDFTEPS